MKKLLYIFSVITLMSCNKRDEVYGRLSYQTQDSTKLPFGVRIDGELVDSIGRVGNWDCGNTDEHIYLKAEQYYQVKLLSLNDTLDTTLYVKGNFCTLINF